MKKQSRGFDYKEDCIHLKACRRLQQIARRLRFQLPRYCTDECSAYVSGESDDCYITTSEALDYARSGADSILGGYDSYDVYCSCDLTGQTIGEIIDELQEGGNE